MKYGTSGVVTMPKITPETWLTPLIDAKRGPTLLSTAENRMSGASACATIKSAPLEFLRNYYEMLDLLGPVEVPRQQQLAPPSRDEARPEDDPREDGDRHQAELDGGVDARVVSRRVQQVVDADEASDEEEDGARRAMVRMASTVAVACCCYLVLRWDEVGRLLLTYPEIHLVTLGLLVALGRYTGYRLTELWRFRDMAGPQP